MRFTETKVAGAYLIEPEPIADERGFFARTWCREEFADHGLNPDLAQANISFNHRRAPCGPPLPGAAPPGQAGPLHPGAIWDLALDLRPGSPTYRAWFGAELSADNRAMLYVPEGCAHGFLTLTDGAEVAYQMSAPYAPGRPGGTVRRSRVRHRVAGEVEVINERDRGYPDAGP